MSASEIRSRADMVRIALPDRRAKEAPSLVKLIKSVDGWFLSEWAFEDIREEPFGIPSKRPLVYMTDEQDEIEKSLWFYENDMTPLGAELDPQLAIFAAERYQIDQLVTDSAAIVNLAPYLARRESEPLKTITIIDTRFPDSIRENSKFTRDLRFVLATPETGALAVSNAAEFPLFKTLPSCTIQDASVLVVTKDRKLVTPIEAYNTALSIERRSLRQDGSVETFVLQ